MAPLCAFVCRWAGPPFLCYLKRSPQKNSAFHFSTSFTITCERTQRRKYLLSTGFLPPHNIGLYSHSQNLF